MLSAIGIHLSWTPHRTTGYNNADPNPGGFAFTRADSLDARRAVFTFDPNVSPKEVKKIFARLKTQIQGGRLDDVERDNHGRRIRFYDDSIRLNLTVQIRGGLYNCKLPSFRVDWKKSEIAFDWRLLFTRCLSERFGADRVLKQVDVGRKVTNAAFGQCYLS